VKKTEERLSCNGVEMIREYLSPALPEEEKYVYDVYYAEGAEDSTVDFDDFMLDSLGRKSITVLFIFLKSSTVYCEIE
jgi:hypothetical protein